MVARKDSDTAAADTKAVATQAISREELAMLQTFEQAIALAEARFDGILDSSELGDGFDLVDKKTLVKVPFLILNWSERTSEDYEGSKYVIVRAMQQNGAKIVFVDGSTGVKEQLLTMTAMSGREGGIMAREGLRVSEYDYTDPADGKVTKAKTYYVA